MSFRAEARKARDTSHRDLISVGGLSMEEVDARHIVRNRALVENCADG